MRTVKVADAAKADLQNAWDYVAEYNPEAAGKLVKEIVSKFAVLSAYPQMGRDQSTLLVNLRSFSVKGYLIFYQPIEDGVEILRVLHGTRDIENLFESFFDSL